MRKLIAFMALGLTLVVVAATAQAQRQGGFGGPQSAMQLLGNKSVQEELKLTDEQKTKLKEAGEKLRAEMKDKGFGGFGKGGFDKNATKEDREKAMAKIAEVMKEFNDKSMKEMAPILKEEQLKRLKQIERQQMRMAVFADADVAKELALTDAQKEKIKEIADETTKDAREIQGAIFKQEMDAKDGMKKIEAIRKDGQDRVMEVLKDDQKAKYKSLMGEPFEIKFEGGFGGFGKGKDK